MDLQHRKSILFVGQCYYNTWYLSRELRKLGWKADVLNVDPNPDSQIYYHGEDLKFIYGSKKDQIDHILFYLKSIKKYDIFHFTGIENLQILHDWDYHLKVLPQRWEIKLLKQLGKKILYTNIGCSDGVSQTSFRTWKPEPVCDICRWRDVPTVCSDAKNLAWGKLRNSLADYQITLGGNRKDFNDDPSVHEVPQFYCLDTNIWNPNLLIPANYLLPYPKETIKIYHAVGNFQSRTDAENNKNIKSSHIYLPLIERFKSESLNVELIFFHDVPNIKLRYYQAQADIVVDMLTFGFFGANIREAMMLGKPAICYLRPEWIESMKQEIPEYVEELPVISATPETIYDTLKELILNPEKRRIIGEKSRKFAVKWHSSKAGANKMDQIYKKLLFR